MYPYGDMEEIIGTKEYNELDKKLFTIKLALVSTYSHKTVEYFRDVADDISDIMDRFESHGKRNFKFEAFYKAQYSSIEDLENRISAQKDSHLAILRNLSLFKSELKQLKKLEAKLKKMKNLKSL